MRNHTRSFWSAARFTLLSVLALTAAGCVQVEQVLTLNADGSGSLAVTYAMLKEDIARMEEMSRQALGEGGPLEAADADDPAAMFDFNEDDIREDFKAYEQHGVTLQSVKTEEEAGWKRVHLVVDFKSLEGLTKTEFISDRTVTLAKEADGTYVFRQTASQPAPEMPEGGPEAAAVEEAMAQMMKGFRAVMEVRTPGNIVDTNAGEVDDRSARWEFDLSKDPKALKKAQQLDLNVRFEGDGLVLPELKPAGES
jgi:hypothetical protein